MKKEETTAKQEQEENVKPEKVEGTVVDKDGKEVKPEEPKEKWTTKVYNGFKKNKKKIFAVAGGVLLTGIGYALGAKNSKGSDGYDYGDVSTGTDEGLQYLIDSETDDSTSESEQ